MRLLVTGGAGFIGSHLVTALLARGHEVRVLDDFATGRRENLAHVRDRFELREGSVLDAGALRDAMEGVEVVFHQAALPSVPRSIRDPLRSHEVNVTGTLRVLLAARDAGVRRLVYAASSSAYGGTPGDARQEAMPVQPLSPYAVAKLAGEQYCQSFARLYALETVCLRYFNVFGPRQDPTSEYAAVIPRFIVAVREGRPLTIFGDGSQSRDFTYVENVVQANLRAMYASEASGQVFNVGCGSRTSLNELVEELGRLSGRPPAIDHLPARPGDVRHSLADIARARTVLGYAPHVSFREGLRLTWQHFESEGEAPQRVAHELHAAALSR